MDEKQESNLTVYADPEIVNELPSLASNQAARAKALAEEAAAIDEIPLVVEGESAAAIMEIVKVEHVETPAETPPIPRQTGPVEIIDCPKEMENKLCSVCGDEPNSEPLAEGEKIATVPTDQGVLVQHALCHFAMRCMNLESLLAQQVQHSEQLVKEQRATHQTLAAVIAKTGPVRLHQHNFERAMLASCKLDIRSDPSDGSTTIAMAGASVIHLATKLPKKP